MKIHALTTSVNYSEELRRGVERWRKNFASWTIVTDFADHATAALAKEYGLQLCRTNSFYADGATFNKGRAMSQAFETMPGEDWVLFLDADVYPESETWFDELKIHDPQPGFLYGCWRYDEHGNRIKDDTHGYGYFQLFHSTDELAQVRPIMQIDWEHAGNADSFFMLSWRRVGRLAAALPIRLVHPGGPNHAWYGKAHPEKYKAMERERMRRGGGWPGIEGERIKLT